MGGARFDSTVWVTIWKAREGNSSALDDFVRRYRPPIREFIRQQGYNDADADELSQEVFLRIFKNDVLKKARKSRGRFRSLLLTLTRCVLRDDLRRRNAARRGRDHVTINPQHLGENGVPLEELVVTHAQDREFDSLWVRNILRHALERLRNEHENYFTAFTMSVDDYDYNSIAERMGKTRKEVDNEVHRAKRKLIKYMKEEIASYSSSPEEYNDEVRYLSDLISAAAERSRSK